jgi:hypothetical protein
MVVTSGDRRRHSETERPAMKAYSREDAPGKASLER